MIQPYYSHGGIVIYNCDCREILPSLKADVVVTDPPYGIGFAAQPTKWQRGAGMVPVSWDDSRPDIRALLRWPACVWGGNYFDLPVSRGWIVWIKPDTPRSFASAELAWTSLDQNTRHIIQSVSGTNTERVWHPTQKPVSVMRFSVGMMPDGTVLDPFMGSGTTLVAAKQLGRKAIGIEIEERYAEIAARRLSQEVLPLEYEKPRTEIQSSLLEGVAEGEQALQAEAVRGVRT